MTQESDTLDTPFFDETEATKFASFAGGQKLGELGKLVLKIRNAHLVGDNVEKIGAAFLTTNLLVMSRASRRVVKAIVLEAPEKEAQKIYPVLNALRYYACGDFSRLDNFGVWRASLGGGEDFNDQLKSKLSEISKFLTSSELSSRDAGQQQAETLLSVALGDREYNQGLAVDLSNPFLVNLVTEHDTCVDVISQSLFIESFSVSVSYARDVMVAEIDGATLDSSMASWLQCLNNLFERNMLGIAL